ncbi:hypothetical protein A9Q84_02820 [Halobacteriovorax marinus]|uniref:SIS domain-containing protein n=1 Tax=Halobacteriovorax marinus TaxID=97084 RepID=A0A1Y5FCR0_9BACT|nr:hypothetical protein A9Q84_02820 [Halobacteriovorax marinus]
MPYKIKAQEFLEISHDFKLGDLPTEQPHHKTKDLSHWSKNDLKKALSSIKEIELDLFQTTLDKFSHIEQLSLDITKTFQDGGRVFLCGCGATGRLSLALEAIWRKTMPESHKVLSFMAGGDVALIHSIENFEDYPEYGERQLLELGFSESDLLISCTEGGETPFVIGATVAASKISKHPTYFLYCNPDDILCKTVERSKRVIESSAITKINLTVGPMVLAGSTRMQASTILMLAVGCALFEKDKQWLTDLKSQFEKIDFEVLEELIEKETDIYEASETILYRTTDELGISVLTDTTERSPTFSLQPFESPDEYTSKYSLCYLTLDGITGVLNSWNKLLERDPRTLEWHETRDLTGLERLKGFDISKDIFEKRKNYIEKIDHHFDVYLKDDVLSFSLDGVSKDIKLSGLNLFAIHIILKILLNTHSTLVMGRLGRYESNIMTWVRPSNNKLIDRTIRYILILLENEGIVKSYDEVCYELFHQMETAGKNEALVMKTFHSIKDA